MADRSEPSPTPPSEPWVEELRNAVLSWSTANERDFPWRKTRNPFHLLVAEILLRRTHANRVTQPYNVLVARFPDPASLAEANPAEVRAVFRWLGLAKKADQLIEAARVIVEEHSGRMPTDLKSLIGLPGLGTYSARALLSMAFDKPVPMVDESSGRVLRRVVGLPASGAAYSDKKLIALAEALLPAGSARQFNLGLLDLAALLCRPFGPRCGICPLLQLCNFARQAEGVR